MRSFARLPVLFFFNDTATTEIYTLSLQRRSSDLPGRARASVRTRLAPRRGAARRLGGARAGARPAQGRSEEHTSELQSRPHLVCRLLLEKKKILQASAKKPSHVAPAIPSSTPGPP